MKDLIQKLEVAIFRRNSAVINILQPALSREKITKALKRVKMSGLIDPIIELYSWRNGTVLHGYSDAFKAGIEAGFAPPQ